MLGGLPLCSHHAIAVSRRLPLTVAFPFLSSNRTLREMPFYAKGSSCSLICAAGAPKGRASAVNQEGRECRVLAASVEAGYSAFCEPIQLAIEPMTTSAAPTQKTGPGVAARMIVVAIVDRTGVAYDEMDSTRMSPCTMAWPQSA